jgi:hypothetical protein
MLSAFVAKDSVLEYTGPDSLKVAYDEIRTAIMDSGIPVRMPIGFTIISATSVGVMAIERESGCMESMPAVSSNVRDILFIGNTNQYVQSKWINGEMTTGNAEFTSQEDTKVDVADTSTHILTSTEKIMIAFYVKRDCGYKSMEENAKIIGEKGYFPLNTTFSLLPYINVLPFTSNGIRVIYKKGMTPMLFNRILKGE